MSDAIVPDDKDWTWVLERPCPDCGYAGDRLSVADVPEALRANAVVWADVLAGDGVAARPRADVWSPLEYACHVRDVFVLFGERLRLILAQDDPEFPNWDQDATAVAERYGEQDPDEVSDVLVRAAGDLAAAFAAITPDQHDRTGRRSDGARFTVESFARYLVHDPVHHVWDVTGATAAAQGVAP